MKCEELRRMIVGMENEELRRKIDRMKIGLDPAAQADCIEVKMKSNRAANMIVRALSVEYNNACCAEDGHDFYIKVCDYLYKLYSALIAISNERWSGYIASVELGAEFSAKTFIAENHEYLEADKVNRISYMTTINNMFRDFVFTFFTLLNTSKITLMKILDGYYNVDLDNY